MARRLYLDVSYCRPEHAAPAAKSSR